MRRTHPMILALAAPLALAVSCSTGDAGDTQTLIGSVEQASFLAPVTAVTARREGEPPVSARVAADGRFALKLPVGTGYRLEFSSRDELTNLVLPRKSGVIESTFDVRGGGTFDMGKVRYVGDLAAARFSFGVIPPQTQALTSGGTEDRGDGRDDDEAEERDDEAEESDECAGGKNATGAVCIDDEHDRDRGQCRAGEGEGDDDREDHDEGEADDRDHAGEGDDEGEAGDHDEADADTKGESDRECRDDDDRASGGAVAEHNLPSVMGCGKAGRGHDEDDEDEDEDDRDERGR